jgi:hypothetical protein
MDAVQSNFNGFGMFALACQLKVLKVAIRVFLVDFFIRISRRTLFCYVLCELKSRRGERGVSDDKLVYVDHSSLLMASSNLAFKSFSFRGNSLLILPRTLRTKASILQKSSQTLPTIQTERSTALSSLRADREYRLLCSLNESSKRCGQDARFSQSFGCGRVGHLSQPLPKGG